MSDMGRRRPWTPCARAWWPNYHRATLWDEVPVAFILGQRKLCQRPPTWVRLGASATANYVYTVWVNGTPMGIWNNKRASQLAQLPLADHNWAVANQAYIRVTERWWEPQAAADGVCTLGLSPLCAVRLSPLCMSKWEWNPCRRQARRGTDSATAGGHVPEHEQVSIAC